ncbi:MAG: class I SAM-dependent methyltransferase [Gaiellaceae bacterium]|jgi:predicted O-methyltransferase YrrM
MTTQDVREVRELTATVDGWLFPHEGPLLYELARRCTGRGVIVEIGSWKGKSTIWLARGARAGSGVHVYAIDPHTGYPEQPDSEIWTLPEFERNLARASVGDHVTPIVATSREAAAEFTEPIELLFIDGAHDVGSVRHDLEAWTPKVVEGGVIALHDTGRNQAPLTVAAQTLYAGRGFRDVRFVDTISYARTTTAPSIYDRIRGRVVLRVKLAAQTLAESEPPSAVRAIGRTVLRRFR